MTSKIPNPHDDLNLDQLADEFEKVWRTNRRPELAAFLRRVDSAQMSRLAELLIPLDIEYRVKAAETVLVEDYREVGNFGESIAQRVLAESEFALEGLDVTIDSGSKPGDAKKRDQVDLTETRSAPSTATKSKVIGPYKLLQKLGEGGMGEVWMAEQEKPVRRRVALKLIRGDKVDQKFINRFEAERQALAMMNHENIAKVLDAGATDDGHPYFVMELVQGIPFTTYCDKNKLSINQRLELFIPVCKAVQHAHQKGIIHRDLKPSNVLVCLYDGKPVPKVIDFGLAKALEHTQKLTDKTMFTEFGQVVGSVQYMSPEQAEMNQLDIDTRTDIYSLGVMLYELLTGSTPIDKETAKQQAILQILATIRDSDPPRPSARLSSSTNEAVSGISAQRQIDPQRLKNILRGELDWIVMKALEKDRTRRYDTANGFANDIQNYLQGEVVTARPPSTAYRIQKYVRRHRGLVASLASIVTLLIAGFVGIGWFAYEAEKNRQTAEAKTRVAAEAEQHAREVAVKAEQEAAKALEQSEIATKRKEEADAAQVDAARQAEIALREKDRAIMAEKTGFEQSLMLLDSLQNMLERPLIDYTGKGDNFKKELAEPVLETIKTVAKQRVESANPDGSDNIQMMEIAIRLVRIAKAFSDPNPQAIASAQLLYDKCQEICQANLANHPANEQAKSQLSDLLLNLIYFELVKPEQTEDERLTHATKLLQEFQDLESQIPAFSEYNLQTRVNFFANIETLATSAGFASEPQIANSLRRLLLNFTNMLHANHGPQVLNPAIDWCLSTAKKARNQGISDAEREQYCDTIVRLTALAEIQTESSLNALLASAERWLDRIDTLKNDLGFRCVALTTKALNQALMRLERIIDHETESVSSADTKIQFVALKLLNIFQSHQRNLVDESDAYKGVKNRFDACVQAIHKSLRESALSGSNLELRNAYLENVYALNDPYLRELYPELIAMIDLSEQGERALPSKSIWVNRFQHMFSRLIEISSDRLDSNFYPVKRSYSYPGGIIAAVVSSQSDPSLSLKLAHASRRIGKDLILYRDPIWNQDTRMSYIDLLHRSFEDLQQDSLNRSEPSNQLALSQLQTGLAESLYSSALEWKQALNCQQRFFSLSNRPLGSSQDLSDLYYRYALELIDSGRFEESKEPLKKSIEFRRAFIEQDTKAFDDKNSSSYQNTYDRGLNRLAQDQALMYHVVARTEGIEAASPWIEQAALTSWELYQRLNYNSSMKRSTIGEFAEILGIQMTYVEHLIAINDRDQAAEWTTEQEFLAAIAQWVIGSYRYRESLWVSHKVSQFLPRLTNVLFDLGMLDNLIEVIETQIGNDEDVKGAGLDVAWNTLIAYELLNSRKMDGPIDQRRELAKRLLEKPFSKLESDEDFLPINDIVNSWGRRLTPILAFQANMMSESGNFNLGSRYRHFAIQFRKELEEKENRSESEYGYLLSETPEYSVAALRATELFYAETVRSGDQMTDFEKLIESKDKQAASIILHGVLIFAKAEKWSQAAKLLKLVDRCHDDGFVAVVLQPEVLEHLYWLIVFENAELMGPPQTPIPPDRGLFLDQLDTRLQMVKDALLREDIDPSSHSNVSEICMRYFFKRAKMRPESVGQWEELINRRNHPELRGLTNLSIAEIFILTNELDRAESILDGMTEGGDVWNNIRDRQLRIEIAKRRGYLEQVEKLYAELEAILLEYISNKPRGYSTYNFLRPLVELYSPQEWNQPEKYLQSQQRLDNYQSIEEHDIPRITIPLENTFLDELELIEQRLEKSKAELGMNHPVTLSCLSSLAFKHYIGEDVASAISVMNDVVSLQENQFGRQHPETRQSVASLAVYHLSAGQLDQAITLLEEAFVNGELTPDLLWIGGVLKTAYLKAKRLPDYQKLAEEELKVVRSNATEEPQELAQTLLSTAQGYLLLHSFERAQELLQEYLQLSKIGEPRSRTREYAKSLLGEARFSVAQSLADSNSRMEMITDAESLLIESLDKMNPTDVRPPPFIATRIPEVLELLIELNTILEKPERAEKYRERKKALDLELNSSKRIRVENSE